MSKENIKISEAPSPEGLIWDLLDMLDSTLETIEARTHNLAVRLKPILEPPTLSGGDENDTGSLGISPNFIPDRIKSQIYRLDCLNKSLGSFLENLHI